MVYIFLLKLFKNISFGKVGSALRLFCLRHLVPECGKNIFIGTGITFVHLENLYLKNNISIRQDCYIDCSAKVTIGNDVSIAHGVSIISFNHSHKGSRKIRENELIKEPITIEDDCWINCILGGVPAKVIKRI